jgi:hypothetical protein
MNDSGGRFALARSWPSSRHGAAPRGPLDSLGRLLRGGWGEAGHKANLDDGAMWPTIFAVMELTAAEEARIGALVNRAES